MSYCDDTEPGDLHRRHIVHALATWGCRYLEDTYPGIALNTIDRVHMRHIAADILHRIRSNIRDINVQLDYEMGERFLLERLGYGEYEVARWAAAMPIAMQRAHIRRALARMNHEE